MKRVQGQKWQTQVALIEVRKAKPNNATVRWPSVEQAVRRFQCHIDDGMGAVVSRERLQQSRLNVVQRTVAWRWRGARVKYDDEDALGRPQQRPKRNRNRRSQIEDELSELCRLQQFATVLEMRCGPRMSRRKRRTLDRFLAADRSLPALGLMAARGARELVGTPETLGAEWMLFHALAWRRLVSLSARASKVLMTAWRLTFRS